MRRIGLIFAALFALLIPVVAMAAAVLPETPPDPAADPIAFVVLIVTAFAQQNPAYAIALLVLGLVFVLRTYGPKIPRIGLKLEAFLTSDPGGVVLAFLAAFGLALIHEALAPTVVLGAALWLATKAAFYAVGGFTVLKKLVSPVLQWLWRKIFPSGADAVAEVDAKVAKLPTPSGAAATADMINRELDR